MAPEAINMKKYIYNIMTALKFELSLCCFQNKLLSISFYLRVQYPYCSSINIILQSKVGYFAYQKNVVVFYYTRDIMYSLTHFKRCILWFWWKLYCTKGIRHCYGVMPHYASKASRSRQLVLWWDKCIPYHEPWWWFIL